MRVRRDGSLSNTHTSRTRQQAKHGRQRGILHLSEYLLIRKPGPLLSLLANSNDDPSARRNRSWLLATSHPTHHPVSRVLRAPWTVPSFVM
jgi:hypothetical protein